MSLLSSPRRRRRLLWLLTLLVVAGIATVGIVLLPSGGGPARGGPPVARGLPPAISSSAEERTARRSAAEVQPLADRFVEEMLNRHDLDAAWQLLAPPLRARYSLADWRAGSHLPVTGARDSQGGSVVAFSGRTTVGLVTELDASSAGLDPPLYALRFDKLPELGWRLAYLHRGHASSHVTAADYSPAGFAPGSHRETWGTWLILVGGLAGLIAVVALVDRRLGR